jgi:type VI secretion system protein ImpM
VSSTPTVGFYGKLPCRGDFLQRRTPAEFVDSWDGWLRECLTESRLQLQECWLETYLTSPVWRFVLARGACGANSCAGVLLPSVDQVGRYFPLTVVAHWEVAVFPRATLHSRESWFDSAQALGIDALEAASLDLDEFDRSVAALAARLDPTEEPFLWLRELERAPQPMSLWWTYGSNDSDPTMLCMNGLPDPESFTAMLLASSGSDIEGERKS